MTNAPGLVVLGDVMKFAREAITVDPSRSYPNVGMLSFGRGVFKKPMVEGSTTSATQLYRIRKNQFIYSRLFAFEGAYGVVPDQYDGYFVSNEFPTFNIDENRVVPRYLEWLFKIPTTWDDIASSSVGIGHRRQRVHPEQLLKHRVFLPHIAKQHQIAHKIEKVADCVEGARSARSAQQQQLRELVSSAFYSITQGAPPVPMAIAAPLVRRPISLSFETLYPELGIRSFFKGTFHKPPMSALELGSKRVFEIHAGDLVFSNVFAWEGAIAIAATEDAGRVGSHRFMTCLPAPDVAEARYLLQYFQTPEGFAKIQEASPGGAGRNRTLGLEALAAIKVPLPSVDKQRWFSRLHEKAEALIKEQQGLQPLYQSIVPAMLERAFRSPVTA